MWYTYLKGLHVTFVALSVTGFFLRGAIALRSPGLLRNRWLRTLPHINDTLLLVTGVTLAVWLGFNPLEQPWLATKLGALVLYIVLGFVALRRSPLPAPLRGGAWLAALAVFGYMVAVALSKRVWPF